MGKWGRKILFWTLVALFFAVAPSVIMFAKGYRFDFSRGVFVHSGTITLKTNPQEIDLSINGEAENSKQLDRINNAFNVSGLMPKDYSLTVGASGFQSWSKKIDVHSGAASEFWSILLVRDEYGKESYAADGIEKFFVSPKSKSIVYTAAKLDGSGVSAKVISLADKSISAEFDFAGWRLAPAERKENIEWSPGEDFLSIPLEKIEFSDDAQKTVAGNNPGKKYHYFIADPATGNSFDLNEMLGKEEIKNVRWDPKDKNYLFFLEKESFYRANITDKNDTVLIADMASVFDLSENAAYFSKLPNELVYKTGLDGKGHQEQMTFNYSGLAGRRVEKMIVYDDLRIAFLDNEKNLFIFNRGEFDTYSRKLSGNIEGMHFSNDGKKLLYWTENEIATYFLRQWNVQPLRNENETQDITRYSEKLANVQWFKDYEHIIFSTGQQVKIIELDPRDRRNCMNLIKTTLNNPFVIYNGYLEQLFFTDLIDSKTELNSIKFPEETSFLGVL